MLHNRKMQKLPICVTEDYLKNLTIEQKEAVISDAKYSRIIAAAGSGKTKTVVSKVLRLIDQGAEPSSVVAFTFTEKAAAELKQRIYENAGKCLVPEVAEKIGAITASTIHAFCLNLIQSKSQYANHALLDESQTMALLLRFGPAIGIPKTRPVGEKLSYQARCERFISSFDVMNDELIKTDDVERMSPDFYNRVSKFNALLSTHRFFTFGMVIRLAVEMIESGEVSVGNIKHLLVDEYQDVNRAQHKLVELIGKTAETVTGVGDARQCIYEWRGSNPNIFIDEFFSNECKTFRLSTNFRSVPDVIETANKISSHFEDETIREPMAIDPDIDPRRKAGGKFISFSGETEKEQADHIAKSISKLISSGYRPSNIAILLRSINSAPIILDSLKKEEIPVIVSGRISLFEKPETKAIGKIFVWAANSAWSEGEWADRITIEPEALLDSAVKDWEEATGLRLNEELLKMFREQLRDGGYNDLSHALQDLLVSLGIESVDHNSPKGAVVWTNIGRFNELLTDFQTPYRLQGRTAHWTQELTDLAFYINGYAQGSYDRNENEILRGVDAVQIMTIHQAKGLEWPIVFVPNIVKQRFPVSFAGREDKDAWELSTELFNEVRYRGGLDSERKLFYVAVTRARDILFCSVFRTNSGRKRGMSSLAEELLCDFNMDPNEAVPKSPLPAPKKYDPLQIFAPTQILFYKHCPFCYFLRFECGYQPGVRQPIGFGKSVHAALHGIAERLKTGVSVTAEDIKTIVKETFHLPFAGERLIETMRRKAENIITEHIETDRKSLVSARDVEARIEFMLDSTFVIAGRIDIIINENNELEIRDYKTAFGEEGPINDGALQLRMYTAGLQKEGEKIDRATIVVLNDNKKSYVDIGPEAIKETMDMSRECVEGIAARKFDSSEKNSGCGKCDYLKLCQHCREAYTKKVAD